MGKSCNDQILNERKRDHIREQREASQSEVGGSQDKGTLLNSVLKTVSAINILTRSHHDATEIFYSKNLMPWNVSSKERES